MTTATNFEGEVIVGVGTYSIPVTATDVSGNAGSVTNTRTFTANGLSTTLAYDLSGNQTLKSNASSVLTFGWDGANRCVAITNGIYRTAIAHDGANRWTRITEYSNSVVIADRRFIWNGVTLAEERDASNNVIQRFFPDGFQRGGTNYFYVKDHLGSVREVYSQSGALQARFDYDPYGNKTQTYGTLKIDFGFAGLFELPNGIKLAVWRIYDPATGRWLSKDPIKEDGGLNLYAYCGGDPISSIDTLGYGPTINRLGPDSGSTFMGFVADVYLWDDPNSVTVAAHAGKAGILWEGKKEGNGKYLTPADFVEVIKATTKWKTQELRRIYIYACNTGNDDYGKEGKSFAQQVFELLGSPEGIAIIAPDGFLGYGLTGQFPVQKRGIVNGKEVKTQSRFRMFSKGHTDPSMQLPHP